MEEKVLLKVAILIDRMNKNFKINNTYDEAINERICGMLDALEIITGNSYTYDENGVTIERR